MAQYGHNSVDVLHVMIEAKKLAYARDVQVRRRPAVYSHSCARDDFKAVGGQARKADRLE